LDGVLELPRAGPGGGCGKVVCYNADMVEKQKQKGEAGNIVPLNVAAAA